MEKTFRNRLKVVLAEKNKTGTDLAEDLGVTDRTVSRWARNHNQPDLPTLARIADVLGVRLSELVPDLVDASTAPPRALSGAPVWVAIARNSINTAWSDLGELCQYYWPAGPITPEHVEADAARPGGARNAHSLIGGGEVAIFRLVIDSGKKRAG